VSVTPDITPDVTSNVTPDVTLDVTPDGAAPDGERVEGVIEGVEDSGVVLVAEEEDVSDGVVIPNCFKSVESHSIIIPSP
jgi:hypothetical protein